MDISILKYPYFLKFQFFINRISFNNISFCIIFQTYMRLELKTQEAENSIFDFHF